MSMVTLTEPRALPTCDQDEHDGEARYVFPSEPSLGRAAGLFRAAGDVARLRLLDYLMGGERCVSEIARTMEVGMSTVSQQLRLLREEHLVTSRRAGKHIYYALADDHIRDILRSVLAHAGHCEAGEGGGAE
jgi:DNA-binding transcriptional ArsR family regulator